MLVLCGDTLQGGVVGFNEALLFKITSFYGNEWVNGKWVHNMDSPWVAAILLSNTFRSFRSIEQKD